jgi:glycosyltransferase involved in cell wall biosynthesis
VARIVSVYQGAARPADREQGDLVSREMGYIRWLRMAEELARLGHQVDVAVADELVSGGRRATGHRAPVLGRVSLSTVCWGDYDVVKTEYHKGFETLERFGGADHPGIIAHLGSTVAPEDRAGIYFYGETRAALYATQQRVDRASRYVALLTPPAKQLWEACFGPRQRLLVIPGAADRDVPPPGPDPYPPERERRVLFSGNVYSADSQPEAHAVLVDKLNRLGRLLASAGARLYMMGSGDVRALDRRHVRYLGALPYQDTWDYFHFADVGVVVAPGPFLHNNESTKIYAYLRAGLPTVSEAGFPNDRVVREAGLGYVAANGDLEGMADAALEAAARPWDRQAAIAYILDHHTWDRRAALYEPILRGFDGSGDDVSRRL